MQLSIHDELAHKHVFHGIPASATALRSYESSDTWQLKKEDTFFVICGKYFRFEVLWMSSWNRSQNHFIQVIE